jgi:hypothetical protein
MIWPKMIASHVGKDAYIVNLITLAMNVIQAKY